MAGLIHCRRGATAIEYGLFAALAAIVLSSGLSTVGEKVGGTFARAAGAMAATPAPRPSATPAEVGAGWAATPRVVRVDDTRDRFLDDHADR